MLRHFDEEIKQLKERLLSMSALVEESISLSIKSLMDKNAEIAEKVVKSDDVVNMFEIEIDELSLRLLALYQPQAGDLRFITSAMKMNNDLERIGDLAVNIAELAIFLLKGGTFKMIDDIPKMAKASQEMLKDSLNAFVNRDSALAKNVCKRDDEVDNLNRQIFKKLVSEMGKDKNAGEKMIDLILVAKNLERIADHSTNICEDVIYMVEGRTIKHHLDDLGSQKT